jgi:hypothetical protein
MNGVRDELVPSLPSAGEEEPSIAAANRFHSVRKDFHDGVPKLTNGVVLAPLILKGLSFPFPYFPKRWVVICARHRAGCTFRVL